MLCAEHGRTVHAPGRSVKSKPRLELLHVSPCSGGARMLRANGFTGGMRVMGRFLHPQVVTPRQVSFGKCTKTLGLLLPELASLAH